MFCRDGDVLWTFFVGHNQTIVSTTSNTLFLWISILITAELANFHSQNKSCHFFRHSHAKRDNDLKSNQPKRACTSQVIHKKHSTQWGQSSSSGGTAAQTMSVVSTPSTQTATPPAAVGCILNAAHGFARCTPAMHSSALAIGNGVRVRLHFQRRLGDCLMLLFQWKQ